MDSNSPQITDAEPLTSSACLQGERVSFTGTLASMTHRQAQSLVEENGGTATHHVSKQTSMLVVGEEGWPLEEDGQPSLKLQQITTWQTQGLDIQVVSESDWLRLLDLDDRRREVHRLYTPAMLSSLLGVSTNMIRRWERVGLIRPTRRVYRLPYFDFQEVNSVRRLSQLLEAGVSETEIEASLSKLQFVLGEVERPLAQLRILAQGSRVLYHDGHGLLEPKSGQRVFQFDEEVESESDDAALAALPIPEAPNQEIDDLNQEDWGFDEWFDRGCELLDSNQAVDAAEAFRLCLMQQPSEPEVHFNLADALFRQGNTLGALERYHVAVELDHDYIEAWTQLGSLHAELGQFESALEAYEIALNAHPEYPDANFHTAQVLHQLGRTDDAVTYWEAYLRFDSRGPWAETARQHLETTSV